MEMALISDIADTIAALGIILTLGFLAFEQHKNTEQAKIETWNLVMQGIRETRRRTDSPHVADVIARGITSREKLAVIGGSNGGLMARSGVDETV
mgnify:CR=1 FL=1